MAFYESLKLGSTFRVYPHKIFFFFSMWLLTSFCIWKMIQQNHITLKPTSKYGSGNINQITASNKKRVKDFVRNHSNCIIPSLDGFPMCAAEVQRIKETWKYNPCFKEMGIDGSSCSIIQYLAERGNLCPQMHESSRLLQQSYANENSDYITVRKDVSGVLLKFGYDIRYRWMRQRTETLQQKWILAAQEFEQKFHMKKWKRKKILLHPSLLNIGFGEQAFKGGPLGELVQWTDIICSIYILGHDISLAVSEIDLKRVFSPYLASSCLPKQNIFDVIYTDILGMQMMRKVLARKFRMIKCKLRIVDSFGTEPVYNNPGYAGRKNKVTTWGGYNLIPKQFNTMFPHTPDNTFLGFVTETTSTLFNSSGLTRRNRAVVYGKSDSFWKDKKKYIDVIHKLVEIHGTVSTKKKPLNMPPYVVNHNVLPSTQLYSLLRSAKIFVGMGFPYEGPAPMEAIREGLVFLNPIIQKPSWEYTAVDKFFKGKPTDRRPTSQHPYAETFIGPPHVRMVDLNDLDAVEATVKDILNSPPVAAYLPYEFTCEGMLERVAFLLEKQEFCSSGSLWPPLSSLKVEVADERLTCVEACSTQGLICEPHFFPSINKQSTFESLGIKCDRFLTPVLQAQELDYPAFINQTCYLQGNKKLFSCSGRFTKASHICPCRDYIKGQVSMCKDCYTP